MKKLSYFVFIMFFVSMNVMAQLKVIYPNVNEAGKELFGYAALKLALENSGRDFELIINKEVANDSRIRKLIDLNLVSISDFGTSPEFEDELLPIYFPIDLGLNGWRIFLTHKDNEPQFAKVKAIEDLKKLVAGQGIGWSDIRVLEQAGLKVMQAAHMTQLFKMIEHKRFDYLPLGANEFDFLLDKYQKYSPSVIVEQNIILIYPFGRLFFVHKNNRELHDAVYAGLVNSFENGSFWELFKSHKSNRAIFSKANLKARRQFIIDNPQITSEFKKIPKKYFFGLHMLD